MSGRSVVPSRYWKTIGALHRKMKAAKSSFPSVLNSRAGCCMAWLAPSSKKSCSKWSRPSRPAPNTYKRGKRREEIAVGGVVSGAVLGGSQDHSVCRQQLYLRRGVRGASLQERDG